MRILVTGHTGFKGSWLCLMLKTLGHQVHGIGLDPLKNGIFELASVGKICSSDTRLDIRNKKALDAEFLRVQPEVILHLAAFALVLPSYEQIYETYSTNVSGTLNVLDSSLLSKSLKAIVVVTTDKVYENNESKVFVESDPLGGKDPYSSSKALADKLTQDWASLNRTIPLGIARAGNVIGGGDVCANRLIPDIISAINERRVPEIRNPNSVRPWQHVLDCLSGYLKLMEYLVEGNSGIFNFGPKVTDYRSVEDVTSYVLKQYNLAAWKVINTPKQMEQNFLALDSRKANKLLRWENKLNFTESLDKLVQWEVASKKGLNLSDISMEQIQDHFRS